MAVGSGNKGFIISYMDIQTWCRLVSKKFCLLDNVMNNLKIHMKGEFLETVALYVVGARTDKYLIKIWISLPGITQNFIKEISYPLLYEYNTVTAHL